MDCKFCGAVSVRPQLLRSMRAAATELLVMHGYTQEQVRCRHLPLCVKQTHLGLWPCAHSLESMH